MWFFFFIPSVGRRCPPTGPGLGSGWARLGCKTPNLTAALGEQRRAEGSQTDSAFLHVFFLHQHWSKKGAAVLVVVVGGTAVKVVEEEQNGAFWIQWDFSGFLPTPPQASGPLFFSFSVFYHFYHFRLWLLLGTNASVLVDYHTRIKDQGDVPSPYRQRYPSHRSCTNPTSVPAVAVTCGPMRSSRPLALSCQTFSRQLHIPSSWKHPKSPSTLQCRHSQTIPAAAGNYRLFQ